jgi:hypothetical protein
MKEFTVVWNDKDNIPCVDYYTPEEFLHAGGINGLFQSYTNSGIAIIDFGWIGKA